MNNKVYLKNFFETYNLFSLTSKQEINCLNVLSLENYNNNFSLKNKKAGAKNVGKNF